MCATSAAEGGSLVPEIEFQPEKRTIEELFVGVEYFVIPRFQRPYSWDPANLDDFWRDVVHDNDVGYFIGPMVAWRSASSPVRRLVDGQQRLTTIALMFAVLRDRLRGLGENKLADGVHRYLEKTDRDNETAFTLQTEVQAKYLSQAILKDPPDPTIKPKTEEEKALAQALSQITKFIDSETAKRNDPVKWLRNLRDRLLGLRVIWVEHSNEDDAYIIFETLNSRGKDLEVIDLLKNHLLNKLRDGKNAAADVARSRFNDMRLEIESDGTKERLDINRYILHWWLSQQDYVAQRKLYRAIKEHVKSKPLAKQTLDGLSHDAPLYRAIMQPALHAWPTEEVAAGRSLQALEIFRVVQPAPLLLSLMRARDASPKLNAAQFRKGMQTIERFHFQYTVVSQLSSSGGVSEMYAKSAKDLANAADDQNKRANTIKEICGKLVQRAPDREQFVTTFEDRFFFTNDNTRDSKLVRYVLATILRALHPGTSQDYLTIEHIMPQSALKTGTPPQVVGSIGNLLLVNDDINGKLGSKEFAAKKAVLAGDGKMFDIGGILNQSKWEEAEIRARTTMLAELAYDKIWKLPA